MSVIKIISVTTLLCLSMLPGKVYSQQAGSLISFDVKPGINHSVLIEWEMKQEADTLPFEVQRSRDQTTWERIADIPVQSSPLYSFTDTKPREGLNYYRVWRADSKQDAAVSGVKWVQVNKTGGLYIWPNPAKDMLYIKTPFVKGRIGIIDSRGTLIFTIVITKLVTNVPTDRLSKGIYFIHVKHGNEILVERFVKE
jgi:Secretion system C-terminal sorting domain